MRWRAPKGARDWKGVGKGQEQWAGGQCGVSSCSSERQKGGGGQRGAAEAGKNRRGREGAASGQRLALVGAAQVAPGPQRVLARGLRCDGVALARHHDC